MEERMDRVAQWVETLKQQPSIQADEAAELPEDLKRGVLSEDGLYNLLAEYEDLMTPLTQMSDRNALQR